VRRFLQNNLVIFVLINCGNVFSYLYHFVMGRAFTPAEYGSFNALNSMAVVLAAPVAILPMVFSRYTVQLSFSSMGQVKSLLIDGLKVLFVISASCLVIGVLALPWMKDYLHLDTMVPILIVLAGMVLSHLMPALLGIFQGLLRFFSLGIAMSCVTVVRFLAGLLLVLVLGWGINGALLAGIIGTGLAIGLSFKALNDVLQNPRETLPQGLFGEMGTYALPVIISTTMVAALGMLDMVLVRHYCMPEDAGLYATAAILGRIALSLPGVLIMVLFPEAAKAQESGTKDDHMLWMSIGMTVILGGGFALFCIFWPEWVITILFGAKYRAAAPLLQITSLAMAMLAVANVMFTYNLAHSEFAFLWPLSCGVVLMLALVYLFHDTALTIARILLVSVGTILAVTIGDYLRRKWLTYKRDVGRGNTPAV
jgi:O-antigen/teichoic acid export membrane protein